MPSLAPVAGVGLKAQISFTHALALNQAPNVRLSLTERRMAVFPLTGLPRVDTAHVPCLMVSIACDRKPVFGSSLIPREVFGVTAR